MWAGAISLLYRVTATEAKATAMPRNILPRYSMGRLKAVHVITTPMSNRIPAINIVVFLPYFLHVNGSHVQRHSLVSLGHEFPIHGIVISLSPGLSCELNHLPHVKVTEAAGSSFDTALVQIQVFLWRLTCSGGLFTLQMAIVIEAHSFHRHEQKKAYLVTCPAGRAAKTPAMKRDEVNHWSA